MGSLLHSLNQVNATLSSTMIKKGHSWWWRCGCDLTCVTWQANQRIYNWCKANEKQMQSKYNRKGHINENTGRKGNLISFSWSITFHILYASCARLDHSDFTTSLFYNNQNIMMMDVVDLLHGWWFIWCEFARKWEPELRLSKSTTVTVFRDLQSHLLRRHGCIHTWTRTNAQSIALPLLNFWESDHDWGSGHSSEQQKGRMNSTGPLSFRSLPAVRPFDPCPQRELKVTLRD